MKYKFYTKCATHVPKRRIPLSQKKEPKNPFKPTRKEERVDLEFEVLGGLENISDSIKNFFYSSKINNRIKKISERRLLVAQEKIEEVAQQLNYIFDSL